MRVALKRALLGADEVVCHAIEVEPEARTWAEEGRSTAELGSAIKLARLTLGPEYGGPANAVVIEGGPEVPAWVAAAAAVAAAAEVEHRQPAIFLTEKGGERAWCIAPGRRPDNAERTLPYRRERETATSGRLNENNHPRR